MLHLTKLLVEFQICTRLISVQLRVLPNYVCKANILDMYPTDDPKHVFCVTDVVSLLLTHLKTRCLEILY